MDSTLYTIGDQIESMQKVVIIGNGIAGITAARHIRKKSDCKITVISAETDHFFSRTALMYIYMGHLKYEHTKPYEDWFWKKNKIELKRAYVESVDFENKSLKLKSGESMSYDKLILATGATSNKFGWPGQELKGVQGLYSYQDLESMELNTAGISHAAVVGGGLIGIEMVEMLRSRDIPVTFLVREESFWDTVLPKQESELINRHIRDHHIDLRLGTELKEIVSDEQGRARAVITTGRQEIPCQFVGLTVGVHPNVGFLKISELEINKGILVNEFLETNIPDVYAVGDCVEHRNPLKNRRAIEQVWYTGRIMGETVAETICGEKRSYQPGVWFNSAKFLDIEYQTYGHVGSSIDEHEDELYWEHLKGQKCVHFVFDKTSHELIGVNAFGIRMRHEIFDRWLNEKQKIEYVLEHLEEANFDPEFFDNHEQEIVVAFNSANPESRVRLIKKKGLLAGLFA